MKKIKLNASRLELSKEKIASLSRQDLQKIRGGGGDDPTYGSGSLDECDTLNCSPFCESGMFEDTCENCLSRVQLCGK
ncbi:class I lanthipeptide [Mucilaginibacter aquaedulcis]|uniref:class I lanthipeptide n=1 Tax=Mucilaginibacter aquaedulcis TaxID=1187081 RepID=UPI0025B2E379|nr:class I lanthipeptide [Mucilaginibacter aquaedulcis]MDN3548901.1 class I lanthipeptide [Mucilaginibacter aquaedulcis]